MHYFYIALLSLLVFSCQQSKPSEMDVYHSAKAADYQELDMEFNKQLTLNIDLQKNNPIGSTNFVVANNTLTELNKTLATLKESSDNSISIKQQKSNASSEKLPVVSSSTNKDELSSNNDSVSNTTNNLTQLQDKVDNAGLLLNVRDYQDTYNKVQQLATKYNFSIVSEKEHTTDFHKGNFMEIYLAPENFNALVSEFKNLAVVIRKKYVWQQEENHNFLKIKSQIATSKATIDHLEKQLTAMQTTEDKLRVQTEITKASEQLDLLVLTTKTAINNKPYSTISLSFFQNIDLAKPAPESFSADFSSNLSIGWVNFKQFVLDAALIWPYIILGLLFLITASFAVSNSRKKERQFKLQLLNAQHVQPQIVPIKQSKN